MDDRQLRFLRVLTTEFDQQPLLDRTQGAVFYPQLRTQLIHAGASEADFEFLTEHLVKHVVESGGLFTRETQQAQLDLIALHFALRDFTTRVNGGVATIEFVTPPPTRRRIPGSVA